MEGLQFYIDWCRQELRIALIAIGDFREVALTAFTNQTHRIR